MNRKEQNIFLYSQEYFSFFLANISSFNLSPKHTFSSYIPKLSALLLNGTKVTNGDQVSLMFLCYY